MSGETVVPISMSDARQQRLLMWWWVFWLGFFSITYLARPIIDPDFFWHLRSGQWLLEHRALLVDDPFTLGGTTAPDFQQHFTLTSYWLSQLLYAVLHALLGWWGIAALRYVIALGLVCLVYRRMQGDAWIKALLLVIFAFVLFGLYPIERPQFFSFLGFSVLLYLLDRLRSSLTSRGTWLTCLSVFLLLVLWGNLHGGVLIGQVVLVLFALLETFRSRFQRVESGHLSSIRTIWLVAFSGLAGSLMNPNGLNFPRIFLQMFGHKDYFNLISEYNSLWQEFASGNLIKLPGLFLLVGAALYFWRYRGKSDLTQVLLVACFAVAGTFQIRYFPFMLITAAPLAAQGFSLPRLKMASFAVLGFVLLIQVGLFGRFELNNLTLLRVSGFVSDTPLTPVSATEHILKTQPPGNMLNFYTWGGYLMYRMPDSRKVFVDGRFLYPDRLREWFGVVGLLPDLEQSPDQLFDQLVQKYGIGYVVIPKYLEGRKFWLAEWLNERKDWDVTFYNSYSVVFVRNDFRNNSLLELPSRVNQGGM